ncbi:uncharacterized protein TNCV_3111201 [Trichonephila clavipes]|nr:uncharacterized protein TNCV_3111201 [Trichonephila clavipes]
MVTNQAPFHHLQKTWERRFTGPLGDSLIVTSIVSGHFSDTKENQIAVTVQDGLNATLHILETNNGTTEVTANLGMRSIMSMSKISGAKGQTDAIILESMALPSVLIRTDKKLVPLQSLDSSDPDVESGSVPSWLFPSNFFHSVIYTAGELLRTDNTIIHSNHKMKGSKMWKIRIIAGY